MTWFLTAIGFAKRISWQFLGFRGAIALALLIALPIHGCIERRSGYSDGEQAVKQRLRDAEAKALRKASEAFQNADKAGEERALAEAEAHNAALEAIREAEAEGRNPLDAIFGGQ